VRPGNLRALRPERQQLALIATPLPSGEELPRLALRLTRPMGDCQGGGIP